MASITHVQTWVMEDLMLSLAYSKIVEQLNSDDLFDRSGVELDAAMLPKELVAKALGFVKLLVFVIG